MSSPKFLSPVTSQTEMLGYSSTVEGDGSHENEGEGGADHDGSLCSWRGGESIEPLLLIQAFYWQFHCMGSCSYGSEAYWSPSCRCGCDVCLGCSDRIRTRCESWGSGPTLTWHSRVEWAAGRNQLPVVHPVKCN